MAGAPKGNKNAALKPGDKRHGFYADVLPDDEARLYLAAQNATLADEVAVGRIKLNRLLKHMTEGGEVAEGTMAYMDRMIGRIGDLEVKRSIIERNRLESGAGTDEALERTIDVLERTQAHRATFRPNGKTNGKGANGNGHSD